jgi:phosphoribosyl-AMP cyclohydrolase
MFPIVKKEKTAMTTQELKFDEKGLIPAVVQDFYTKKVLTVAYMNAESLDITLREKRTCFWSRSRQELWRKGETSAACGVCHGGLRRRRAGGGGH